MSNEKSTGCKRVIFGLAATFLVNNQRDTQELNNQISKYMNIWAILLTVKRDTQGERTTKSRNSWGSLGSYESFCGVNVSSMLQLPFLLAGPARLAGTQRPGRPCDAA